MLPAAHRLLQATTFHGMVALASYCHPLGDVLTHLQLSQCSPRLAPHVHHCSTHVPPKCITVVQFKKLSNGCPLLMIAGANVRTTAANALRTFWSLGVRSM